MDFNKQKGRLDDDIEDQIQVPTTKDTRSLLKIIDTNEAILYQLKDQLKGQLQDYQQAFSTKVTKQYTEYRDFDPFKEKLDSFKKKSMSFIDSLATVKANCSRIIKDLPQQQKVIPTESKNGFDMFVNDQIDRTVQYNLKNIAFNQQIKPPFEKAQQEQQKN